MTPRWNAVVPVNVSPPSVYRFPGGAALVGNTSGAFFAPNPDGGVITVPMSPPEEVLIQSSVQYMKETAISVQDRTVMELRFTPGP